ncbi:SDR family NAD(P)-dependent oxidoreductase [Blastococcus sp. SYSU D00669]
MGDARIAVVTGGAQGIGFAVGKRLVAQGCRVALLDLDGDAAEDAARRLDDGAAAGFRCDVTDREQIAEAAKRVEQLWGPPQVLVANQGGSPDKRFLDMSLDEQQRVIDLNYVASLDLSRQFLPGMVDAGGGRVVYISSDAARAGVPGQAVYAGAKAALIGFAKSLAVEVARHAITVNVVCPGSTETAAMRQMLSEDGIQKRLKLHPMRRFAQPDDIATAVQYFASPDASFVTGQVISVNGGMLRAG